MDEFVRLFLMVVDLIGSAYQKGRYLISMAGCIFDPGDTSKELTTQKLSKSRLKSLCMKCR